MNASLILATKHILDARRPKEKPDPIGDVMLKTVKNNTLSYTSRHRGTFFKPEYDLREIQEAQDTDSFLARAIKKKADRFMIAGWEFIGNNPDTVDYIKRRIAEMEIVSGRPFNILIRQTANDLVRYSNAMWAKVRSIEGSTGASRVNLSGKRLDPVAGYFILPFETLEFETFPNGDIKRIKHRVGTEEKTFQPEDVIHFYTNKKPGFCIGTPEVLPALDDIALLRRMEENVEELVETNLFPTLHYKIGSDQFPQRYGPDGESESDKMKKKLEYMPAHSVYITDHRHEIQILGAESKALRVDFYLTYFRTRVLAGLAMSTIDIGEGDSSNRSTAGTLSKGMIQEIEAVQEVMKTFLDFYVIYELLQEGLYDPLDPDTKVEIRFGVIDREERTKMENTAMQLVAGDLITVSEGRERLGERAYREEDWDDTYYKRVKEPLALVGGMQVGNTAEQVLAELPVSNVTPEAIKKAQAVQAKAAQAAAKLKPGPSRQGSASTSQTRQAASQARPSNQYGTRTSAKFSKDTDLNLAEEDLTAYHQAIDKLNEELERRSAASGLDQEILYKIMQPRYSLILNLFTLRSI